MSSPISPVAAYTVRLPDGQEFGPAPIAQIAAWARDGRIPVGAKLVGPDGGISDASVHAEIANHLVRPASNIHRPPTDQPAIDNSGLGRLIPASNPAALISYYVGIVSCITGPLGLIGGAVAIVFGVKALRRYSANPAIHGRTHAWVGLAFGTLAFLLGLLFTVGIVIAVLNAK